MHTTPQSLHAMAALSEKQRKDLVAAAFEAKKNAYAKYSNFPVGAALLSQDGTIITGRLSRGMQPLPPVGNRERLHGSARAIHSVRGNYVRICR